jgi:uncharacterized protein (DUF1015 family)
MAEIRAFRAYRYDLGRVGRLSDVVAPPYDVIDAALQDALYAKSAYNVIRLILGKGQPTDSPGDNRYTRAAHCLRDWQREGILGQDSARALYVCHQEFEVENQRFTRRGFLARVRLERFGEGAIFPHEETLPGPKADRLHLFRATGMNLSPVFGLYPDETRVIQGRLDAAIEHSLPVEATDHLGIVSRLWSVSDQQAVSAVTGLLATRALFIADGHHRYETALAYRDELGQAGQLTDREAAANFVLMMLVGMSDPGLVILPTHRLVSGLPELTAERLRAILGEPFRIEFSGEGEQAARLVWDRMEADGSQQVFGFGTAADQVWQLARYGGECTTQMQRLAADHSAAWRELAVAVLHVYILAGLIPQRLQATPECRYVHLLSEAITSLVARQCALAVLVPPAKMRHVEQIAGSLEKMPPKSTYFYPKLLSGLVFNSLKGH